MRYLYTFLFYCATPFILARLCWKGRSFSAYRQRIHERFSIGLKFQPIDIWLHAVSLGEVIAATPLVEAYLEKNLQVCITTMTPTGSAEVIKRFKNRVIHQYVPYDLPHAIRLFLKKRTPRVAIMMETEIWPNIIKQTTQRRIPLFLANARISHQAYPQYRIARHFFAPLLNRFTAILTQSDLDFAHFKGLGANPNRIKTLGNMKFDLKINQIQNQLPLKLKQQWGTTRPVILLASTHADEEQQIIQHLKILQHKIPTMILMIAPRHPQRFEEVFTLCHSHGFKIEKRSAPQHIDSTTEIVILDSLGELLSFYTICDYAVIGGSFVPIGGHNVLEPIALNKPVLCGPFMQNSQSIIHELSQAKALIQVKNTTDLIDALAHLHHHPQASIAQIKQAKIIFNTHQGAVQHHLKIIEPYLKTISNGRCS